MYIRLIAHALLKNEEGKFLIIKRCPQNDILPGLWDIPGGTVEDGERIIQALKREVMEEVGLIIEDPAPIFITENIDQKTDAHFVKMVFCADFKDNKVTLNQSEHDQFAWISLDQVNDFELVDYLSELFGQLNEKG